MFCMWFVCGNFDVFPKVIKLIHENRVLYQNIWLHLCITVWETYMISQKTICSYIDISKHMNVSVQIMYAKLVCTRLPSGLILLVIVNMLRSVGSHCSY